MAKEAKTTETVEENLFGGFKFINEPIPAEVKKVDKSVEDKTKTDEISPEAEAALEKAKKEVDSKIKSKETKKVEEIENEESEEIQDEEVEDTSKIEDDKESEFSVYAKYMSEKGILDLNEDDKIETEEDLENIQKRTIINGIESYKQSKPEDVQKFIEFVDNGGNPADFHKYYYGDGTFEGFDISSEEDQKYVITEALKLEGYTDEEIIDEINDTADLGKLEKKAGVHLKKLQKIEKEQKELLLEAQKKYAKEQEELRTKEWEAFKKGLFDKEAIAGFKLTPKSKQDLWDYMVKPINKKTGETQYQRDSNENTDARYMFAYLLKNKWDVKSLERQVETKQVSKLKSKLNNYSDSKQKLKGSIDKSSATTEQNPFQAFKTILNQ